MQNEASWGVSGNTYSRCITPHCSLHHEYTALHMLSHYLMSTNGCQKPQLRLEIIICYDSLCFRQCFLFIKNHKQPEMPQQVKAACQDRTVTSSVAEHTPRWRETEHELVLCPPHAHHGMRHECVCARTHIHNHTLSLSQTHYVYTTNVLNDA